MTHRGHTVRLRASRGSRISLVLAILALAGLMGLRSEVQAAAAEIVLYAADVSTFRGNWRIAGSTGAADGSAVHSDDNGFQQLDAPAASPSHYFEVPFDAPAGTAYHVWLRLKADGNSKWNDSVWVQFSDAVNDGGSPVYRTGSTSGLLVNLEPCKACGVSGWGWQDSAYWYQSAPIVKFASSGTHTLRVQTREDGAEIDQITLSPVNYLSGPPGPPANDSTILPRSTGSGGGGSAAGPSPFMGTPFAVPGVIQARDYDLGGPNIAFQDATTGNTGGAYRTDDVDLQSNPEGGDNVGWFSPGDWMKYSVNVASAGAYTAKVRVASPNTGTSLRVMFDESGASVTGTVPTTGGWQAFTDLTIPVTLAAGPQVMTLRSETGGFNVSRITLEKVATGGGTSGLSPYGGTPVALPGTIRAERFDEGGAGVAFADTTPGNSGGQFRSTDVDIEKASDGTYDVGWTAAGEWLNYTVNVTSAGDHTVGLRVASKDGATMHVGFNGASNVWTSVSIPATGGWQKWTTVELPATLSAGTQQMTIKFDTGGVNLNYVVVTKGSTPAPPSSGGGSSTFRMMTWNIKHGQKKNGSYDPRAQAQLIAAQNPDVVALQEVETWDENQPEKYRSLLEEFTGDTWRLQWAPVNGKSSTEGNVILTRLPVISSTYHQMHATSDWDALYVNRSVAQATISVGGVSVNVFSTHVDYYSTAARTIQVADLMDWASGFGGPQVVGGDFNSWWGESWIKSMMTAYTDTWEDVTGSNQNGYTVNNAVRFDYLFRAKTGASRITPIKCYVPVTDLSDHNPVVADYTVK